MDKQVHNKSEKCSYCEVWVIRIKINFIGISVTCNSSAPCTFTFPPGPDFTKKNQLDLTSALNYDQLILLWKSHFTKKSSPPVQVILFLVQHCLRSVLLIHFQRLHFSFSWQPCAARVYSDMFDYSGITLQIHVGVPLPKTMAISTGALYKLHLRRRRSDSALVHRPPWGIT